MAATCDLCKWNDKKIWKFIKGELTLSKGSEVCYTHRTMLRMIHLLTKVVKNLSDDSVEFFRYSAMMYDLVDLISATKMKIVEASNPKKEN